MKWKLLSDLLKTKEGAHTGARKRWWKSRSAFARMNPFWRTHMSHEALLLREGQSDHSFRQRGRSVWWHFCYYWGLKPLQVVWKISGLDLNTEEALLLTEHKIQPQTHPERPWTKCDLKGKQWQVFNLRLFFYQIPKCWFKVDKLEIRTYTEFSTNYSVTVYWRIFLNRELNAFLENM